LSVGVYQSTDELAQRWRGKRRFLPTLATERADVWRPRWEHAVRQTTPV